MKNKILPILCVFILISLLFLNNSVFASTTVTFTDDRGIERTVPAFPETDLFDSSNSYCVIARGNYENGLYIASGDGFFYNTGLGVKCSTACYQVFLIDNEYIIQSGTVSANNRLCYASELCYYSTGLYSDADKSSLEIGAMGDFFHQAPMTLAETLELNNPMKTFQTMMSGIIPYLIALVVGLVAFWKAWQLLLKELRKA